MFGAGYLLTFWIKWKWVRVVAGVVALVTLFTLPVRDEIKGKEEFEALCKAGGVYQISPKAEGKKLNLSFSATRYEAMSGLSRPVREKTLTYTDTETGEVVATGKAYSAGGGWLVQKKIIALTSTSGPLLGRDECYPSVTEDARIRQIADKFVN